MTPLNLMDKENFLINIDGSALVSAQPTRREFLGNVAWSEVSCVQAGAKDAPGQLQTGVTGATDSWRVKRNCLHHLSSPSSSSDTVPTQLS